MQVQHGLALPPLATNAYRYHTDSSLAIGVTVTPNSPSTRRAAGVTQPVVDAFARGVDGTAIAWDGRLDNASTLRCVLGSAVREGTAAEIVIAAYAKWGEDAFERLIGDFSFALWNPARRCVHIVRDFSGVKPLWFCVDPHEAWWASDLWMLCRIRQQSGKLALSDDGLRRFMLAIAGPTHSPYTDLQVVPPGYCVTICAGQVTRRLCWQPTARDGIRYRCESEYQDHFVELFRQAVSCRLPPGRDVWAELSGGMDSSSIVCMADHVMRAAGRHDGLSTVTYRTPAKVLGDELPYLEAVEQTVDRPRHHVAETDFSPFFPSQLEGRFIAKPTLVVGRRLKVVDLMETHGVDVLLSGQGGDDVMWSATQLCPDLADLLCSGRLSALHQRIRRHARALQGRTYWNLLWREAIAPILGRRGKWELQWPAWLLPAGGSQPRTMLARQEPTDPSDYTGRLALAQVRHAMSTTARNVHRTCGAVDAAYPYLDRRLVQFMLSIPFDQKVRPGVSRWLHRTALHGLLPEKVQTRRSKASGTGIIYRAMNRDWDALMRIFGPDARIVQRGLIAREGMLDSFRMIRKGAIVRDGFFLLHAIALETWLRHFESSSRGVLAGQPRGEVQTSSPIQEATHAR